MSNLHTVVAYFVLKFARTDQIVTFLITQVFTQTRLTKRGINRLKDRRVRGNLIEMYKYKKGLDEINWERNPVGNILKVGVLTRSNGVKIRRNTFKSKARNDFVKQVFTRHEYFFNRITPTWNALPIRIVQATNLNMFKKGLDDRYKI